MKPARRLKRKPNWLEVWKQCPVPMARDLEVTDRTVKRDIQFLRDRYGLPIKYHEEQAPHLIRVLPDMLGNVYDRLPARV